MRLWATANYCRAGIKSLRGTGTLFLSPLSLCIKSPPVPFSCLLCLFVLRPLRYPFPVSSVSLPEVPSSTLSCLLCLFVLSPLRYPFPVSSINCSAYYTPSFSLLSPTFSFSRCFMSLTPLDLFLPLRLHGLSFSRTLHISLHFSYVFSLSSLFCNPSVSRLQWLSFSVISVFLSLINGGSFSHIT